MSCLLISGYRQHGKDTFLKNMIETADLPEGVTSKYDIYINEESKLSVTKILAEPGHNYKRIAFADILKQNLAAVLGMDVVELENSKSKPMSSEHIIKYPHNLPENQVYRDAMIDLGLYMRSEIGDWYWAKLAADTTKLADTDIIVITDLRFPSEFNFGRFVNRNVVILRVHRENAPIPPSNDPSEHSLNDYPFDIIAVPKGQDTKDLFGYHLNNGCTYFKICS